MALKLSSELVFRRCCSIAPSCDRAPISVAIAPTQSISWRCEPKEAISSSAIRGQGLTSISRRNRPYLLNQQSVSAVEFFDCLPIWTYGTICYVMHGDKSERCQ